MKTLTWSFYNPDTGLFSGDVFTGTEAMLEINAPRGVRAIEGRLDRRSQRVDLQTGEVVDYVPPQPSDEHEWDAQTKRWELRADVAERRAAAAEAQRQIEALERQQLRPMRELAIDPANVDARARLRETDSQIEALRSSL